MSDDQAKRQSEADAALQREILQGREFTLAEAIGQMAGPGIMKGVSPVTPLRQAAATIQDYLTRHLTNASGKLPEPPARALKHENPGWQPRSPSAVG